MFNDLIDSNEPMKDEQMFYPNENSSTFCMMNSMKSKIQTFKFSHYSLVSSMIITSLPLVLNYHKNDVISWDLQFSHLNSVFQIFTAILCGSKIIINSTIEINYLIESIKRNKITSLFMHCDMLIPLFNHQSNESIESINKITCFGSSFVPPQFAFKFINKFTHIKVSQLTD